jgi:hypothetical protein
MTSAGFSAAICMILHFHFAMIDAQLDQFQHANLMKLFNETGASMASLRDLLTSGVVFFLFQRLCCIALSSVSRQ